MSLHEWIRLAVPSLCSGRHETIVATWQKQPRAAMSGVAIESGSTSEVRQKQRHLQEPPAMNWVATLEGQLLAVEQ